MGHAELGMDTVCSRGLMARNTEDNGLIIRHMGRGRSGMLMETAMKESSRGTNLMDMVCTLVRMEPFIRGFGWMTFSMGKDKRNGLMEVSMLDIIKRDAGME